MLGLPVIDSNSQARHSESASALRSGRRRSKADVGPISEQFRRHARPSRRASTFWCYCADVDDALTTPATTVVNSRLMRVLAIDTALEACSVAVLDTERADLGGHESLPMQRGHAEALMPLIARVLDRAQLDFSAIDRLAVTTGPGSFTGLRVGIAAARGIALAAGKPAIGLTTLAAFAAPFIAAAANVQVVA